MYREKENSVCDFAEDSVSYLYGEIGESEKEKFAAHLNECLSCAAEISDFGIVRSAIQDWREKEFAPLQTPLIKLPELQKTPVSVNQNSPETRSAAARLREFFRLSPVWTSAAASCAALLIFASLFFVTVNSPTGNDDLISEKTEVPVANPIANPTITAQKTPEVKDDKQNLPESSKPQISDLKAVKTVSDAEKSSTRILTQNVGPVKQKIRQKLPAHLKTETVRPPKKVSTDVEMPGDTNDEDDSLRLADLFEEVDGK